MKLSQMLNELNNSIKLPNNSSTNSARVQYPKYISSIINKHGGDVETWLNSVIYSSVKGGSPTPMEDALAFFTAHFASMSIAPKTMDNYKRGYRALAESVLGFYYANVWAFSKNIAGQNINLFQLIPQNVLFASADVVKDVINGKAGAKTNLGKGNPYASWDCMIHVRDTKVKKGTPITRHIGGISYSCIADDNTTANQAIKRAILLSRGYNVSEFNKFRDYEACHIWDDPYDPRYYANIANLVLVPRSFADLTDHCDPIKELLRYEAYKRFGNVSVPIGKSIPACPKKYSSIIWRQ